MEEYPWTVLGSSVLPDEYHMLSGSDEGFLARCPWLSKVKQEKNVMIHAFVAVAFGLALLVWSANRFVEGSASVVRHFGIPPLLIGMVIMGFGTSMPEMVVSVIAALQGNPGIALGNAYGSNIANIALILGLSALISPIAVRSQVLRRELPLLTAVTAMAAFQLLDGEISRADAVVLLAVFGALMTWTVWKSLQKKEDFLENGKAQELEVSAMPFGNAVFWLMVGFVLLVVSSRVLVWGAVEIAHGFGVGDLVIGLTIVAVGTSLPELASSTIAAYRGEHDMALGNILGSNLFNTLAVVGIAGTIHPLSVGSEIFHRDLLVMAALTLLLFVFGSGFREGPGRINRVEGTVLLACYFGYTVYLISTVLSRQV